MYKQYHAQGPLICARINPKVVVRSKISKVLLEINALTLIHNTRKVKLISDIFVLLESAISLVNVLQRLNLCLNLDLRMLINMDPISEHEQSFTYTSCSCILNSFQKNNCNCFCNAVDN
jgi:hypothetical protein